MGPNQGFRPLLRTLGRLWRYAGNCFTFSKDPLHPVPRLPRLYVKVNWRGTQGNREPGMAVAADMGAQVAKKVPSVVMGFVPGVLT